MYWGAKEKVMKKVSASQRQLLDKPILGKPLWDWLDVCLVPFVIFLGSSFLIGVQIWSAQAQHNNDQQIAQDNRYEESLNAYRNSILTLLLDKDLRNASEGGEVRNVAHSLTHEVTRRLDGKRKGQLVRFLRSLDLIRVYDDKIPAGSLAWVDLSGAYLEGDNMLDGADLREANMLDAKVTPDQLASTTFIAGATLPDGTRCSEAKNWRDMREQDQIKQKCVAQYKQNYDKDPTRYSALQ